MFTTTCACADAAWAMQTDVIRSKSGRTLGNLDPEVRQKFNNGSCEDSYAIGPVIGKGGFATVRRGVTFRNSLRWIQIRELHLEIVA